MNKTFEPGVAEARRAAFKVAAIYAFIGGAWILFSDRILLWFLQDPEQLTRLQTVKGWFFVLASAGLLAWLVRQYMMAVRHKDERLHEIALGMSVATGEALFNSLAKNLATILHADCALIYELTGVGNENMRSLAAYAHGKIIDNFECRWAGTPCEKILESRAQCFFPSGVRQQFPQHHLLEEWAVESFMGTPLIDSAGRTVGLMVVMDGKPLRNQELTEEIFPFFAMHSALGLERMRAEEVQSRLASIVESSDDAIIGKTLDSIIVSWNPSAEKIYGYSAGEVKGKPISILVPPDSHERVQEIRETIRRGERIDHFETVHIRKDGKPVHVSLTVSPLKDTAGNLIGSSTIARDITRRKHLEETLRTQFDQITTIFDSLDAVVYAADLETTELLYLNRFGISIFREDWQGRTVCEVLHTGEFGPCESCPSSQLTSDGEPQAACHWESHNVAAERWYRCTDKAIRWSDGRLVRLGIATDITELKKSE